jgi:hypothetical protein
MQIRFQSESIPIHSTSLVHTPLSLNMDREMPAQVYSSFYLSMILICTHLEII